MAAPLDQSPTLWVRASDLTGSDGDQITTWTDQSGNTNNLTGAGSAKPLLRTTAGPTGGKAVEFQGTGYFSLSNIMSAAAAGEVFVVIKRDADNNGLWAWGSDANNSDEAHYTFGGVVYESFGKATNDRSNFTPTPTVTNWNVYNVWSASNDWAAYINGRSGITDATNTVTWTSTPRVGLGRKNSADDIFFDGYMAELIVFRSKLSGTDRDAVHAYLYSTYGVGYAGTGVALQGKTEVALTTNPQSITIPTVAIPGDWLVLVATSAVATTTLVPSAADLSKWRWTYVTNGNSSNMSVLVAWKQYFGSDTAPSIGTGSAGYAALYCYSGVGAIRPITQATTVTALQNSPYVSASTGEHILWLGAARRTGTPAPTPTLSRGTLETNQNANFNTLVAYREALASDVNMVQATMANAGSAATYSQAGALVLSPGASYVYKGRDDSASDTTGAA